MNIQEYEDQIKYLKFCIEREKEKVSILESTLAKKEVLEDENQQIKDELQEMYNLYSLDIGKKIAMDLIAELKQKIKHLEAERTQSLDFNSDGITISLGNTYIDKIERENKNLKTQVDLLIKALAK